MKIKSFNIDGLYDTFSIQANLNENVNVIVGNNGSFKTTLIKLLRMIVNDEEIVNLYPLKTAVVTLFPQNISLLYRQLKGNVGDIYDRVQKDSSLNDVADSLAKMMSRQNSADNSIIVAVEQRGCKYKGENIAKEKIKKDLLVDFISTFDVKGGNEKESLLDSQLEKLKSEYSYYLSDLAKQMTDIIEKEGSISKEQLAQINGQKNLMISFVNKAFASMGKRLKPDNSKLTFVLKNGEDISIEKLSAGEKQLLIIFLTVLLERNKEYVVLMDEPEISLHIEWQYNLIEMLTQLNPSAQFILTTHSPSIFAAGWGDKIIYMEDILSEI